ncbi:MAG: type II secretion system F family protein [Candidatus Moranbacteria bacterium]|jgi:type IV pilus assembly protein PilC|nr:type II secretion system F family protein [Candidatus Moranbacteria bacterium]
MIKFKYIAKNEEGKERKGEMEASSRQEVADNLRKENFWAISIKEVERKKPMEFSFNFFLSVPLKNKMIFCRHLAVMITSGLSLSKALTVLSEQEKNKTFKKIISELGTDISKGNSLASSMKKYPRIFNKIFTSMVEVGETSGNLEEILKILTNQLEKDHKLISKIRGAMIYPAVIFTVMILIGILMMIFVVPNITAIFEDFDTELPIFTRILLGISSFMASNITLTLLILIGSIGGVFAFYKTPPGVRFFHKLFLKAPIVGNIVTKVNSARFARILSSLLQSGVSLVRSLEITASTLDNYYFQQTLKQSAVDVQKGINLSKILSDKKEVFPYLVIQMIEVGEETGKTPDVLLNLAEFYEEEVDQITKNLSSIIEPVLMLVIGAAVGFFAVAIIQPIYSIMEQV